MSWRKRARGQPAFACNGDRRQQSQHSLTHLHTNALHVSRVNNRKKYFSVISIVSPCPESPTVLDAFSSTVREATMMAHSGTKSLGGATAEAKAGAGRGKKSSPSEAPVA